ncbi:hypothetical protein RDI58_004010 [Solanum bulbocastanum]
MVEDSM